MRILVVEDERKLARFLQRVLSEEGHMVDSCASGAEALSRAASGVYDLLVLDWMIPDVDGLEVCRQLRSAGNAVAILMLTARGDLAERVMGLAAGADDYLAKPFEIDEFIARANAVMRRASRQSPSVRLGALSIDRINRLATLDGKDLNPSPREFNVLERLALHPNQTVTRTELLVKVWATNFDPESNVIEVCINRLRDKFGEHAWMIETVRGRGYRLRTSR